MNEAKLGREKTASRTQPSWGEDKPHKNIIVSFPRSGMNLFVRLLRHYCKERSLPFSYCEIYQKVECGCRTVPCKENRLFQKNHDFDLGLEIKNDFRYLVLYRENRLEQMEAFFRFGKESDLNGHSPDYSNVQVRREFISFVKEHKDYYVGFLKKWVLAENENILKIEYDALMKNPQQVLSVYRFFFPEVDHSRDQKILGDFLKVEPIQKKSNWPSFFSQEEKDEMEDPQASAVTHYIFYHDKPLLDKAVSTALPENVVLVDLNQLAVPKELCIEGLSEEQARAVYSEYLGILSIKPTSEMVGLFTYSIPLKFCLEYAKRTNLYDLFMPEIKFEYLAGKTFDPNKLYGVEFGDYLNRETGNDVIREVDSLTDFHVFPKDDSRKGPFKGSVVVKKEVFLEFQKWLKNMTLHLLAKYGPRCTVDPKKIENKYKYWVGGAQTKTDFQWRWGLGLILERLMAYYFGRTFSRADWVDLRFFLRGETGVAGQLPYKMKLCFFYTPSHESLKNDWFLPSLKDDFEIYPGSHRQIGLEGEYLEPGWPQTMGKKINFIVETIRENMGQILVFSDVDVQFFSPVKQLLLHEIKDKDMVLIRDCDEELSNQENSNGVLCTGFFIIRANSRTLRLWEAVREFDAKHLLGDQRSLNEVLKNGFSDVKWGLLPDSFYSPGKDKFLAGLWEDGKPLFPPGDMVLHHANFTIGVPSKIKQLKYVKYRAGHSMNIIILPYYSQEEVLRFSRLARIIKHFGGLEGRFEFLLSARYDFPESSELYERYASIAPTKSFRCSLEGKGIVTPENGTLYEGPSAMFWDTMRFIEKNYEQDGGFALWMEADMVPLRKDWLKAISAEWLPGFLTMGFFVDTTKGMCSCASHINGGACYAKDFAKKVPQENFDLTRSWDKKILSYLIKNNLPYKYINGLIDLKYQSPTLNWEPDEQTVILHGVKDFSAHAYVEKKFGMLANDVAFDAMGNSDISGRSQGHETKSWQWAEAESVQNLDGMGYQEVLGKLHDLSGRVRKMDGNKKNRSIFFYALHKSGTTLLKEFFFPHVTNLKCEDYETKIYGNKLGEGKAVFNEYGYIYGPAYINPRMDHLPVEYMRVFAKGFVSERPCWFLIRDPRDILISQYYSYGFTHQQPPDPKLKKEFFRYRTHIQSLTVDDYVVGHYLELLERYQMIMGLMDVADDRKIIIRYEDIVHNFDAFICQIAQRIVLSDNAKNDLFVHSRPRQREDLSSHKRSGACGQYKTKLQQSSINILNEKFKYILSRFNYAGA